MATTSPPSCILGVFSPSTEPLIARIVRSPRPAVGHGRAGPGSQNTCCSGIPIHGDVFTIESTLLVVARLWALAAEAGFENITTACVTSFAIHHECLDLLESEPGLKEKVDQLLSEACGRRLVIPKYILHCSDIVYRYRAELARFMKYRLVEKETGRPLKVVDHVGCHYNKVFPSSRWEVPSTATCSPVRSASGAAPRSITRSVATAAGWASASA